MRFGDHWQGSKLRSKADTIIGGIGGSMHTYIATTLLAVVDCNICLPFHNVNMHVKLYTYRE